MSSESLPRPPNEPLLQWITRVPTELAAYIQFIWAISRLKFRLGSRVYILKVAKENAELVAEVSEDSIPGSNRAPTRQLCVWQARHAIYPASNAGTWDTRNSSTPIGLIDFPSTSERSVVFEGEIPEGADLTAGIDVRMRWTATSATSGSAVWESSLESMTEDIDSDSFASGVSVTAVPDATNGKPRLTVISHTSSQIDGLTAGDLVRLKITRRMTGNTMTGDAELVAVSLWSRELQ